MFVCVRESESICDGGTRKRVREGVLDFLSGSSICVCRVKSSAQSDIGEKETERDWRRRLDISDSETEIERHLNLGM